MFPLAGKDFPTTANELAASIEKALAEVFTLAKSNGVTVEGKLPSLKAVKIDLSGATVSASEPPPKPKPAGKRGPAVKVDKLEVTGQPIHYQKTKLNLKVTGSGLAFDFAHDKKGKPLLVLTDADDGKVEAKITKKDIEILLAEAAGVAAKQQGITVQGLDLDLKSDGPRSVAAKVRVTARKMLMSGTIHITGKLDVDDDLNATVSGLACTGEGMIGTVAAGIVQKKIAPFDGTAIPLMAFSLGDVALRDLKIAVKDSVQVSAAFGKA